MIFDIKQHLNWYNHQFVELVQSPICTTGTICLNQLCVGQEVMCGWMGGGGDYLKCLKRGRTERIGGEINNLKGGANWVKGWKP